MLHSWRGCVFNSVSPAASRPPTPGWSQTCLLRLPSAKVRSVRSNNAPTPGRRRCVRNRRHAAGAGAHLVGDRQGRSSCRRVLTGSARRQAAAVLELEAAAGRGSLPLPPRCSPTSPAAGSRSAGSSSLGRRGSGKLGLTASTGSTPCGTPPSRTSTGRRETCSWRSDSHAMPHHSRRRCTRIQVIRRRLRSCDTSRANSRPPTIGGAADPSRGRADTLLNPHRRSRPAPRVVRKPSVASPPKFGVAHWIVLYSDRRPWQHTRLR